MGFRSYCHLADRVFAYEQVWVSQIKLIMTKTTKKRPDRRKGRLILLLCVCSWCCISDMVFFVWNLVKLMWNEPREELRKVTSVSLRSWQKCVCVCVCCKRKNRVVCRFSRKRASVHTHTHTHSPQRNCETNSSVNDNNQHHHHVPQTSVPHQTHIQIFTKDEILTRVKK